MAKKEIKLKGKKVKGRITMLKAMLYKDNMVYIRRVDNDIFEWMLIFKGELYSSYLIMTPKKGRKKLNKEEIAQTTALLWSGAITTIDIKLGIELERTKKDVVKSFEKSRGDAESVVH